MRQQRTLQDVDQANRILKHSDNRLMRKPQQMADGIAMHATKVAYMPHSPSLPRLCWLICLLCLAPAVSGDVIYSLASNLLHENNGTVQALNTGFAEHNFVTTSDDGRFVVFSSPDPATGNGIIPSSDIYAYDRVTRTTRRIVDHTSSVDGAFNTLQFLPTTATLSPNGQLLAYGVGLTTRQGIANPSRGVTLAVARASDGIIVGNPAGTNPVSDGLQAAFVGLEWDPGGTSFVTPSYVTVLSVLGSPVDLPAIVRFSQQGNGGWTQTPLTTPAYFNNVLPPQARTYIYPALSPSGAGLAFFSLFWPDVIGGTQPVTARLVVANSDGSNPTVLFTFNPGLYPAGLSWSRDGTRLIVAFANQTNVGTGLLPSADLSTAVIRTIDIGSGNISSLAGIDAGYFPAAVDPVATTSDNTLCFPIPTGNTFTMLCL